MEEAVVVDAVRTPSGRGRPGGALSGVHPVDLLAGTLRALLERTGLDPALVDDVVGGCVSQVGEQASNVVRSAVLAAGLPASVPAVTVDRQCGSGQQAVHFAAQGIAAGAYDVAVACGVESMSRVPLGSSVAGADPYGPLLRARYPGLVHQGVAAELVAARWGLGREELDAYAARSHRLAAATAAAGGFDAELVPAGGLVADETVRPGTTVGALAALPPAFRTDELAAAHPEAGWHVTAGSSSPLTDGAAAALLVGARTAERLGLRPRARVAACAVAADDPVLMLTGVLPATRRLLARAGRTLDEVDRYEVNEAFAPVPLAWARDLGADPQRLNPCGGAIALGHPLGATGVRLLATLVHGLEASGGRWGLQAVCEGGGTANAMLVERL
ncbi:thiolase family protein [Vallicoccus soli]|uniref:Thiolase family protein n=1 Tax=Vallicoccus soli TaxID=2339232 RepID=A0A3A3Z2X3_9ACTN|nr:thiolase family protein [Vallicoccus soli]RJK97049.1 thiolase family protein [Vallicoccus soli]